VRWAAGRALQILGLMAVAGGLLTGITRNDLRYEARMLVLGAVVFFAGWLLVRPFRQG